MTVKTTSFFQTPYYDEQDIIPVFSKLKAMYRRTGVTAFLRMATSVKSALHGEPDGYIGEDLLQASALGRMEYTHYISTLAHLMPISLEGFYTLLTDLHDMPSLQRYFQYVEIQKVIDDTLTGGAYDKKPSMPMYVKQHFGGYLLFDSDAQAVLYGIVGKMKLVNLFQLHANGYTWQDCADILDYKTSDSARKAYTYALKKVLTAGIERFVW